MKAKNSVVICDIDGTVANLEHRLRFIKNPDGSKKTKAEGLDWDGFHLACKDDTPYDDIIEMLHDLYSYTPKKRELLFFSGRNDVVQDITLAWLQHYIDSDIQASQLHMRNHKRDSFPSGAYHPDTLVKHNMIKRLGLTPEAVLCILDDRQGVVDMWRDNGYRCVQVDAWKEPSKAKAKYIDVNTDAVATTFQELMTDTWERKEELESRLKWAKK